MLHLEKTEEATAKEQVQTHTRTHAPAALSLVVGDDLVEAQRHAGDGVGHGVRDLDLAHLPLLEPILWVGVGVGVGGRGWAWAWAGGCMCGCGCVCVCVCVCVGGWVGDDLIETQRHAGDGVGHGVRDLDLAHLPLFEPILLGRRKRQLEENMACMPSISL